ncbi:Guanosine-3',5'-bis(diphosphate) 3'-pyrophosphohydrolase / GTP pyrophosphokinase, (p)ppGpp synthetase II [hydrothermal vent metagenome]|uniref:Guanosine-3',5'-bis(Diphosphate) 3'-pyrophosphohydrolase / GTP pyrophosphokinase, (P)ppGpp synthetase II n=1 Tax=hydrothermal vent metagenome TaxID=652676 RepID=A0A3B1BHE1_9ZZZZ
MFLIHDLCKLLEAYLEIDQVKEVYRAYLFGAEAHDGQTRMSGEPYIYHPLAVAKILAEMRMDANTLIAAILHDAIEDTSVSKDNITHEFGEEVAELVDGVTKLTQVKFGSKAEAQAENFRKMILAMVKDIRVILIKLADRLHNMRTLGVMRADKQRRIARETLEIYAPIAKRLGMQSISLELEDLGFRAHYPMRYQVLQSALKKTRGNRKEVVEKIRLSLEERLRQEGIEAPVEGREKHLYSIYDKMRNKGLGFDDVSDVYGFRIVVDKVDTCYRVLGVVHNIYKPMPGRFKDYIAIPKANGYQSLHTVLFGPYGGPIEVQVRTKDMERVAQAGIAAHWMYKTGSATPSHASEWLKGLLEMQKYAGNSQEFLENVKIDLFPDEVYIFTPDGDILNILRGATVVDLAYAIHTDLGNTCVAAKIDRHLAPLRSTLSNGQTVEIITAPGARPNPVWLDFVITGKARSNIHHYLKHLKREEALELGKRMLGKALAALSLEMQDIPEEALNALFRQLKLETLDDLLEDISLGKRVAALVARQLADIIDHREGMSARSRKGKKGMLSRYTPSWLKTGQAARTSAHPLAIRGTEGSVVTYAKCCRPIPGDSILGFVSVGRGIVIHTRNCKNVREFRNNPERWIDVQWERGVKSTFSVDVRVDTANQRGVLATVASVIAEQDSNIENVSIDERDGLYSSMIFTISVRDRVHLAQIIRRVRAIDSVARIARSK